jgi:hypothetical protein
MFKFKQILREALISTSRFPRWWILALAQGTSLYLIGEFSQPHRLVRPFSVCWIILSLCVMAPATAWLWLEISAFKTKSKNQLIVKTFFGYCTAAVAIVACSLAVIIATKLIYPDWLFSALVSSIVSGTSTLAILYAVLCAQPLNKALVLAIDTWNKRISLAALVAFILLLAHGVSYALVHSVLISFQTMQGFSVSSHSATIWVLLLALLFFTAFAAAFLNSFLVILFLEIIGRKKDPEAEKAALNRLVTSEAGQLFKGG